MFYGVGIKEGGVFEDVCKGGPLGGVGVVVVWGPVNSSNAGLLEEGGLNVGCNTHEFIIRLQIGSWCRPKTIFLNFLIGI